LPCSCTLHVIHTRAAFEAADASYLLGCRCELLLRLRGYGKMPYPPKLPRNILTTIKTSSLLSIYPNTNISICIVTMRRNIANG